MADRYQGLFALLDELEDHLEQLTQLAREKTQAVREDDLLRFNEIMNQEQAESMAFRGLDRRREKLLQELELGGMPLSGLPGRCPPDMQEAAKRHVASLQEKYKSYQDVSSEARTLLERTIGEIDAVIGPMNQAPLNGPGYQNKTAAPPPNMKTDFRA